MKGSPITAFVEHQGVMLLDGGLATELERCGHDLKHSLWSAGLLETRPEEIVAVHRAYLDAGADCLVTSSYQATIQGFEQQGISVRRAQALVALTVELAATAREQFNAAGQGGGPDRLAPLIAASVGPYGAYLADGSEYDGRYGLTRVQLQDFHEPRWAILDESVADLIACETIPSLPEAEALVELLNQSSHRYAWMSFSCANPNTLCDGTPLSECAALLAECDRVVAMGVNCLAPEWVLPIVSKLRRCVPEMAIVVYPNSGETYDPVQKSWTGLASASDFGQAAMAWRDAGATIIGGCCRTGPAHIATLKEVLLS